MYICTMKRQTDIVSIFPKHLFWDMDYSKLHLKNDKDIIIPRAMYATTSDTFEQDIQRLENLYTPSEIVKYIKNTKELISNEVCTLVAKRYNVPVFARFKQI
jgi:hypothetical protein